MIKYMLIGLILGLILILVLVTVTGHILTIEPKKFKKKHQHVMDCIEYDLLKTDDGDEITIIVQENKVEIWKKCKEGNIYTGRYLFR